MIECRECNSEIEEVDAFCPFCGIAIERVAVSPSEDDEEPTKDSVETTTDVISSEDVDVEVSDPMAETIVGVPADFEGSLGESKKASSDEESGPDKEETFPGQSDLEKAVEEVVEDSDALIDEVVETTNEADVSEEIIEEQTEESDGAPAPGLLEEEEESAEAEVESGGFISTTALQDDSDDQSDESVELEGFESDSPENVVESSVESGSTIESGTQEDEPEVSETPVAVVGSEEPAENDPLMESNPIIDARDLTPEIDSDFGEPEPASVEDAPVESVTDKTDVEEQLPQETDFTDGATIVNYEVQEEVRQARESAKLTPMTDAGDDSEPLESTELPEAVETENSEEEGIHTTAGGSESVSDELVGTMSVGESDSDESEQAEPNFEPAEENAADASVDTNENDLAAAAPGAEDQPSQTTPNIGGGDTDGGSTPKLKPLDEGVLLNSRYEIVRKIGGGGMGAVYLASDKNLGGVLRAVKEMVQSYIEKEQQDKAVQDFKRESMLLTSLEHPAIPTIYDYFFDETAGRFYLVMKYISGGDLAARLRAAPEGRVDELSVTQWGIEVADVLSYLHNRQPPIVYRDLKPANIMIDGNSSKIMLIDFGIARWVNKEEKGVTAVGTMGYAPPELFSGNVVPSSDIYSLGSTMFHLLTGADPQNNPLLIFDFQKHPRPRQINPNLSDQMERILMRAVEYNADKRFITAAEMRDALADHLKRLESDGVSFGVKETPKAVALSDQPVFCGFCGQKIVATDMFCAFCGAKQPLAQSGVQSQEYGGLLTTAKLMVEGTGDLNAPTFDLAKKESLVGRRDPMSNIFPEVDLSKYDPQTKISRQHARIYRDGETYMLEDLGSSNGTLILQGGEHSTRLAPRQARELQHGDKIRVGDTMLHFVIG